MVHLSLPRCLAVFAFSLGSAAQLFNQTGPGSLACIAIQASLGDKVQPPASPEYLISQEGYWNARQSRYIPSCAVYPTSAGDVSTALKSIKAAKSRFAIKAGGHNPNTFFSSVDRGVLIDLRNLNSRSYDPQTTLGSYGPGGQFGDIYGYFAQYNRTVVGARLAGVGTGLALSGGLSYLSAQYGLACDSFRELEIVLPCGTIVTASPTQNEDLFFASRGGGGNAYGVVTQYTVQTRPSGVFTAGNIFYSAEYNNQTLQAVRYFTRYNTDPKAAIIATYTATSAGQNLSSSFLILFAVYDGPDPGNAFANFTSIPYISNSIKQMPYTDVVNLPIKGSAELSRGDNIFRVQVNYANDSTIQDAFDTWQAWNQENGGSYTLTSLDYEPVPRSLTDASSSQNGGNAIQLPPGPYYWANFLLETPLTITDAEYDRVQSSFRDLVKKVPSAPGLPLFINDANNDQNPLRSFSTYPRLQQIKKKYDPDGFFTKYTGGWSFE